MNTTASERHIEYLVACIDQWRREVWLDAAVRDALIEAAESEIQRIKGGKPRAISGTMAITLDKAAAQGVGRLEDIETWKGR